MEPCGLVGPDPGVHFGGSGGIDRTPVDSDDCPVPGRSMGGAHFDGTAEGCELFEGTGVPGKVRPCLGDVSSPGF
jgi:hypothetical protein